MGWGGFCCWLLGDSHSNRNYHKFLHHSSHFKETPPKDINELLPPARGNLRHFWFSDILLPSDILLNTTYTQDLLRLEHFCSIVNYLLVFGVFARIFFLSAVTVYLFTKQLSVKQSKIIILVIWSLSVIFSIPYFVYTDMVAMPGHHGEELFCVAESLTYRKYYEVIKGFMLLIVLTVCIIFHKIIKETFFNRSAFNDMLLIMIVIHIIPNAIISSLHFFGHEMHVYTMYLYHVPHYVLFVLSVYRPILYVSINGEFHRELKEFLPCMGNSNDVLPLKYERENLYED